MTDEKRRHSSEDVKQPKLLSIVLTGRNDDYMGNFKYRITTCINYIARNLKVLGRLEDVEILVTDWNSDVPLSKVLALSPEAAQICRFIYVPPKLALEKQQPDQVFNGPCATNVSLRRAQSEFLMIQGADILYPRLSLRNLLEMLDGKVAIPFKLDSCLLLCARKHIPWDIGHREPNLDEWDQYLSLNSGELELPQIRWPGLGISCAALMMHYSLWHACHGFDEQLSYWGWSDAELSLRITQYYPWMELLSIGVASFEIEHYIQKGRVLRHQKTNPQIVHLSFTVNDDNWGLGNYELEIQTAEHICKLPEAGKPLRSSLKTWDKTRTELLAELTSQEVKDHLLSTTQRFWWNINPAEWESLYAVAWYSLYCFPCRYLDFGIRNEKAAAVVAAACPGVEIYGIESWQAMNNDPAPSPASATGLLHAIGYRGYLRLVTGDPRTAFRRLRDSSVGPLSLDLALVRGDMFGADAIQQLSDLVPHLAPGGLIVFTCTSEDSFQRVWNEMRAKFSQFTYLLCNSKKTGMILAASLQNDDLNTVSDAENRLRVDFGKPPRPDLGRQFHIAYGALRNPTKYPEYAKRLCRFLFGRG